MPDGQRLQPIFSETTVTSWGNQVFAVIRGGGGVACVSTRGGLKWDRPVRIVNCTCAPSTIMVGRDAIRGIDQLPAVLLSPDH